MAQSFSVPLAMMLVEKDGILGRFGTFAWLG